MSDSPHQFYIASGAVDVEFRKNPAIKHTDTVFVTHVLVDFSDVLSTAETISLVYNSDEKEFQGIKVAQKDLDIGADHAMFEFVTPLVLSRASLQVLFANTDDVGVRVVFIHDYR